VETNESQPSDMSRHLARVRSLVEAIVDHAPPTDREALLAQTATISDVRGNLAFLAFRVDRESTAPAQTTPSPVPYRPEVVSADGKSVGEIMVWLDHGGYLDSLEYTWWADDPPSDLPMLDDLRIA
jgi:hypothetical protein